MAYGKRITEEQKANVYFTALSDSHCNPSKLRAEGQTGTGAEKIAAILVQKEFC